VIDTTLIPAIVRVRACTTGSADRYADSLTFSSEQFLITRLRGCASRRVADVTRDSNLAS
jgi:hypothetical protein